MPNSTLDLDLTPIIEWYGSGVDLPKNRYQGDTCLKRMDYVLII